MWSRRISHLIKVFLSPAHPAATGLNDKSFSLSAQAISQLNRLKLNTSRYIPGYASGLRSSLRRKASDDFHEHRLYVPGDDIRYVDWKASARHERVFIKLGEHPKDATVHMILDTSASLNWGDPSKAHACIQIAAALGYSILVHGDRLVVWLMRSPPTSLLGPISGKGQVPTLLKHLYGLVFEGRADMLSIAREILRRYKGGFILILSDLLEIDGLFESMKLIQPPRWDIAVVHLLHPKEIKPGISGNYQFVDIESGLTKNYDVNVRALQQYEQNISNWIRDLDMNFVDNNTFYTMIQTDWSLDREIIPYFRKIHLLNPA